MNKLSTYLKKHRKAASVLALVLVVAAIFWVVNSPAVVGAAAAERVLPIYSVQRQDKTVAISFDAAWGNEDTQTLIDILNKYGVKATFFVVGAWVDKYPESVKAIADSGNEVMNHSNDHAHFSKLSTSDITANINAANDKIEAVTGVRPTLFRCPYGEYDDHVITAVNSMSMTAVQWSVEALHPVGVKENRRTVCSAEYELSAVEVIRSPIIHNRLRKKPPLSLLKAAASLLLLVFQYQRPGLIKDVP